MSTLRGVQGSAIRVFTSSERRANQLKSVKKIEMGDPRIGKLVDKNGDACSKN